MLVVLIKFLLYFINIDKSTTKYLNNCLRMYLVFKLLTK